MINKYIAFLLKKQFILRKGCFLKRDLTHKKQIKKAEEEILL